MQEIDEAVEHLASLLRSADADVTTVMSITSRIENLALPPRSIDETTAHNRVQDTLAAQRAVALLRTEARLHSLSAERGSSVVNRLQKAQLANNDRFRRSVIEPEVAEVAKHQELARIAAEKAVKKEAEFVVLRREANCAVSLLLARTEREFDVEFQRALSFGSGEGTEAAGNVHAICRDIEREQKLCSTATDSGRSCCIQPVPDGFDPTSSEYLAWLRNQANYTLLPGSEFRNLLSDLANLFGGTPSIAPIKGYERTVQKTQEKYGGNHSRLLDLARGMVVFDDIPSLASALGHIKDTHDCCQAKKTEADIPIELKLLRAKDRLSPQFDASRFTGGYRDILLNIAFTSGHVVELQLHILPFLRIKNRRGHLDYESARSIHMYDEAFSHCNFRWLPDSDDSKIASVLKDISEGAITVINLDYSEGLWSPAAQSRLAEACLDARCRIRDLSLRSCRCGDDFITKCLPTDDEELWSPDNRPVCNTVRLGSKLHEGTAGRISSKGIMLVLRYLNNCLRVFDLQGCLNLEWQEDCGDTVAETIAQHVRECMEVGKVALPQLQELNVRSTGLTAKGMEILRQLKEDGHLKHAAVIKDDEVRTGPPRKVEKGASSRMLW